MADCIFCKIVKGEIPSAKVWEDSKFVSVVDVFPATKGHVLIIIKQHIPTALDVPPNDLADFIKVVQKVGKAVVKATNASGYKIESFNGAEAGQSVPHAHFHVIPRYTDDGFIPQADKNWWKPRPELYARGEIEKYAALVKSFLK